MVESMMEKERGERCGQAITRREGTYQTSHQREWEHVATNAKRWESSLNHASGKGFPHKLQHKLQRFLLPIFTTKVLAIFWDPFLAIQLHH